MSFRPHKPPVMRPSCQFTKLISILLLFAGLSGCASSVPQAHYYTLPEASSEGARPAGAEAKHLLLLRSPNLAYYLDVEGLVMQLDDISLVAAHSQRWAEPLGRQLERGLRDRLAQRLPDTRVMLDSGAREAALTLRLDVERFQGRYDGLAVASGLWQLTDASGVLLRLERFEVTTALADDGYPALVRALGHSWDKLAEQIALAIHQL